MAHACQKQRIHPRLCTLSQLIGACETVLVRGHSQVLWDEFQALLDADKAVGEWVASAFNTAQNAEATGHLQTCTECTHSCQGFPQVLTPCGKSLRDTSSERAWRQ